MEKIENFNEVLFHLKDLEVLTTPKKDFFVFKNKKVYRYFNGSSFCLTLDDFKDLYSKETFYVYENDDVFIDNDKDEAYYRYYKK